MPSTDKAYCLDILIIEDIPAPLASLADLMADNGYHVRQCRDGKEAWRLLQINIPALILLDVQSTEITGYDICRQLKAKLNTVIPVIFISASHDIQSIKLAFEQHVVDYIVKPYDATELLSRVKMHLKIRALQLHQDVNGADQAQLLQIEIAQRRQAEAGLLASRQQLRQLTGHLQTIREEERARIAREIHDDLGQSLTVASIDLVKLKSHVADQSGDIEQQIDDIIEVLEHAANTARAISENLRPGMLDILGLGPAIEHHVQRFSARTGICCKLSMTNEGDFAVTEQISIAIFRIVQEALTNVARHAQASHITIQLADLGRELMLIVQDDGRGMSSEPSAQRHFGLLGMRERVALLGGQIAIGSKEGKGTRIEACIPVCSEVTA